MLILRVFVSVDVLRGVWTVHVYFFFFCRFRVCSRYDGVSLARCVYYLDRIIELYTFYRTLGI